VCPFEQDEEKHEGPCLNPKEGSLKGLLKNSSPLTGKDKGGGENVDKSSLFTLP
jgi:hypothetical protein